ncbi:hypothetical protein [Mesorhizobium sp. M4A.F.Ca.ET.050.02.1.1]|uniref:hypothetical protein n=1 Tax=Mesorhizobium sp. M4A.F.Ca.ET.050.02.1.1 TaxID=2496754 RepID=UPI00167EE2B5|nr:hypothetical protein [Mesorhizobium sp. M4A.F.Ca.ET.050.02.1.1]
MPRAGGVYSAPPGTKGNPNTTIESAKYNALVDDLVADANAARPVTAGGSGSSTAVGGNDNFNLYGADMASAATLNLANSTGSIINVTGTVAITALGTLPAGAERDLVFQGVLTFTHNATSLILPDAANITTAAGDVARMRSLGGGNWKCLAYQRAAIAPYAGPSSTETLNNKSLVDNTTFIIDEADATKKVKLQVSGVSTGTTRTLTAPDADGTVAINSRLIGSGFRNLKVQVTSDTQVTITADALSVEDTSGYLARLSAVNVTAALNASGANGLDTGAEAASTWYYAWVIWNGTTTAALISMSATAPTMPGGYTHKLMVGAIRNDGSSNLWRTLQYGRECRIVIGTNPAASVLIASGTTGDPAVGTYTDLDLSAFIPPLATKAYFTVSNAVDTGAELILSPSASYGGGASSTNPSYACFIVASAAINGSLQMYVPLETAQHVWWASDSGSNKLFIRGWEFNL